MAKQPFERSFIILYILSYVLLLVSLLAVFYMGVTKLQAFATIYLAMLTLPLTAMSEVEPEKKTLDALTIAAAALFAIAAFSTILAHQWRIMGAMTVEEWPSIAAENPLTMKIGETALSLGITPQLLLTIMLVIPNATAEEAFFRITLMNTLEPIMGTLWANITQAALFGLFHFYAYNMSPLGMATAATAGLALGFIYKRTGSEAGITLAHALFNIMAYLA